MDTSWPGFEREWTQRSVDTINLIRTWSGLTIKQLAARLRALGWPVSDATMSGMLSGNKRTSLSIAEVFAFARALNVSPAYIILGLPNGPMLQGGALWGAEPPEVTEVGGWLVGQRGWEPFPGDDVSKASQSPMAFTRIFAEQGLRDTLRYSELLGVIAWQASQLVVVTEFPSAQVEQVMPRSVLQQDFLWSAINQLSGIRRAQAKLGVDAAVPLPEPPDVLRFIDQDPIAERDDFTRDELRALSTTDLMDRARGNIRRLLSENAASTAELNRNEGRAADGLD